MTQDEFLRTRMGRWHLALFYKQMRLFSPANLEPTCLILSGFVVPPEKGMTVHYRIQEESLILGSVMRMVQRSCSDTPRLATQGILQGWVSKWRWVAGDMAQRLRMLATLSEDWSLVPSIHIRWPTTACNSSCRDFQHSLLGSAGTCTHAQTCRHI